jgi:hypothetical protein
MTTQYSHARCWLAVAVVACLTGLVSPTEAQDADAVTTIDGLMWTTRSNGETVAWSDADAYCETLELDGHSDWRLPTLVEVESLYDPDAEARGRLMAPIELADCCAWSSVNLVELEAENKGVLPDPTNPPAGYYWGFLFSSGIRYYSFERFPDGEALCVRETSES